jgi:hypothetical protein
MPYSSASLDIAAATVSAAAAAGVVAAQEMGLADKASGSPVFEGLEPSSPVAAGVQQPKQQQQPASPQRRPSQSGQLPTSCPPSGSKSVDDEDLPGRRPR